MPSGGAIERRAALNLFSALQPAAFRSLTPVVWRLMAHGCRRVQGTSVAAVPVADRSRNRTRAVAEIHRI